MAKHLDGAVIGLRDGLGMTGQPCAGGVLRIESVGLAA